jgi:predicted DNA-binding WGR domain protein
MAEERSPIQHALVMCRTEVETNVHRFYTLMIEHDLFGRTVLVRHWGRIGTRGRERMDAHASEVEAAEAMGKLRVLGEHRYEVADPVVSGEASEQGDADVHHALGLRDHDRASPEPRELMPPAGVVPLDAVRLILTCMELSGRQEHVIDGVVIRTVEPGAPALQSVKEALTSGFVTTAAFPVHQLA